jgi:hypothetical protein
MPDLLDWTKERKAEFRRVMAPHFDDDYNNALMKRPDFPVTEQDRIETIEASCSLLCQPSLDEVIHRGRCLRCGAESGCRQMTEVAEEMFGPHVPMTEAQKEEVRKIIDAHIIEQRKNWRYSLRGITETPIGQVVAGMRGQIVVSGLVTRISSEFVNTPMRLKRRNGRVLSGPTTMLNVYIRDDEFDDILCQVGRFDYERIATPIIDHGKRNGPLWGFIGTVPQDYRMLRVQVAELIGNMDKKRS